MKITFLLMIFTFASSCVQEPILTEQVDFSKLIVGKWEQTMSFDLTDSTSNPPAFDWFDVDNGFSLEFSEDNRFVYTRYGSCETGTYSFDEKLLKIVFLFDCEVNLNGESLRELTEFIELAQFDNSLLFIEHAEQNLPDKNLFSYLKKIE